MKEIVNPTRLKSPLTLLRSNLSSINKWVNSGYKLTPPTQEECNALHNAIIIYAKSIVPTKEKGRLLIEALKTIKQRKNSVFIEINNAFSPARRHINNNFPWDKKIPYIEKIARTYATQLGNKKPKEKDTLTFLNLIQEYQKNIACNKYKLFNEAELNQFSTFIEEYKLHRKIESSPDKMILIQEMIIEQLIWIPYRNIYSLLVYSGYIPDRENLWPSAELQRKWRSRLSATNRQRKRRGKSLINC